MTTRSSNTARAKDLLTWYDAHGRDLPWRMKGGVLPDAYAVWMSEIMLQQTTVVAVKPYFEAFLTAFPTVEALAAADDGTVMEMWAGLGYYARARNLLKCARAVAAEHGGRFPSDVDTLKTLPGIGDYTAAAVSAIAFNQPAAVVDGNIERVISRLFEIATPLPKAKTEIRAEVAALTPTDRPGDFAQAMMDLGATLCTPKTPKCLLCPWHSACQAHAAGTEETYPVKAPKKAKPQRHGIAYWAEADGQAYLIRRPEKGLLGGMLALPSSDWGDAQPTLGTGAPFQGDWRLLPDGVRHVFTHFTLSLDVAVLTLPRAENGPGEWRAANPALLSALPTVMKKAAKLAMTR